MYIISQANVFNSLYKKKTKQFYCVSGKPLRKREHGKKIASVLLDKGEKGAFLTGFDIIFAFVKIKEHVVTHGEKVLEVKRT